MTQIGFRQARIRAQRREMGDARPSDSLGSIQMDAQLEPAPIGIRVRLLREIRDLLLSNPEVFGESYAASRELRAVRCQLTVNMAIAAAKLYRARFAQVDRISLILVELSEGRAISRAEIVWLDSAVDKELRLG